MSQRKMYEGVRRRLQKVARELVAEGKYAEASMVSRLRAYHVRHVFEAIMGEVFDRLAVEEKVRLGRGWGMFVRRRRHVVWYRKGEKVERDYCLVGFKAGKELRERFRRIGMGVEDGPAEKG